MSTFLVGTVIAVLLIGPILALTAEDKPTKKRKTKRSPE